jgi:hypothetical protein
MEAYIAQTVVSLVLGMIVYFMKRTIETNEKALAANVVAIDNLKAEIAVVKREYLHRDDFKEFKSELREMFQEIKEDIKTLHRSA